MTLPLDLTGRLFDRLTVLSREPNDRFGKTRWRCRCVCGGETITRANTLLKGEARSCGCLHAESVKVNKRTHGYARSPIYRVWCSMKGRCLNTADHNYPNYGGRGITVCARWQESFAAFLSDMGPRPPKMTLERKDNNGPYSPENCIWATHRTQMRNTRRSFHITYQGVTRTLQEWAEHIGIDVSALHHRLREAGWSITRALTTPSTPPKGEAHPGHTLSDSTVTAIRQAAQDGATQAQLAETYGCGQAHISRILRGKARKGYTT